MDKVLKPVLNISCMPKVKDFIQNIVLDNETTYWNGFIHTKLRGKLEGHDVGVRVETTLQYEPEDKIYTLHFRFGEKGILFITSMIISRLEEDMADLTSAINTIIKKIVVGTMSVGDLKMFNKEVS